MDGTDVSAIAAARDHYQIGLGHLQRGNFLAAYEEFREATRIDPTNFEIWQKYEETYREADRVF